MFESTIQSKDEEIEVIRKQIKYTANKIEITTRPVYEADKNDTVVIDATDEKEDNYCYNCNFIGKNSATAESTGRRVCYLYFIFLTPFILTFMYAHFYGH